MFSNLYEFFFSFIKFKIYQHNITRYNNEYFLIIYINQLFKLAPCDFEVIQYLILFNMCYTFIYYNYYS